MATKSQLLLNMSFTADTSKAKSQLQDLQKSLTKLTQITPNKELGIEKEINEAVAAAARLKVELQNATNVNTGKLDLRKLTETLDTKKLQQYKDALTSLGPQGQKAFRDLAVSIGQAEVPLKRSNKLISELWVTLKNTAKWQLSSSILHGFMGAVQTSYYYAQDLNKSLNDIRIVTGNNTEQMARFAEQANKAAKALSTTTTDYTNASLIYFQQGLDESQVKERTDVTIKMANAAGVSAEKVSDQMTAVWNNFDDGSKSLEYYADVMTALGAATASSTDEIAAGLEKFAAVSSTIGLSYEYATASLATITAETRQSADVVGNALKTLFSRIQGLSLGETLEDGTDLNKYSAALDKIGISIKDTTGNIKDMDTILDELGARWGELAKDEQLAVAQTVAGVRQYTQLVALMDNWDTFQENLGTAKNSSGTLDKQAEIYAESWEAAQDRVTAALERIYGQIIDDDAFIGILDALSEILDYVGNLIDAFGGVGGVITMLGALSTKIFKKQMSEGLQSMAYNLKGLIGKDAIVDKSKETKKNAWRMVASMEQDTDTEQGYARSEAYKRQAELQELMIDNADRMSAEEIEVNQILMDRLTLLEQIKEKEATKLQGARDAYTQTSLKMSKQAYAAIDANDNIKDKKDARQKYSRNKDRVTDATKVQSDYIRFLQQLSRQSDITEKDLEELKKKQQEVINLKDSVPNSFGKDLQDENSINEFSIEIGKASDQAQTFSNMIEQTEESMRSMHTAFAQTYNISDDLSAEFQSATVEVAKFESAYKTAGEQVQQTGEEIKKGLENPNGSEITWSDRIVSAIDVGMTAVSVFQTLSGVVDTLKDPDMTGWEKFTSIFGAIVGITPMVISSFGVIKTAFATTGAAGAAAGTAISASFWYITIVVAAVAAAIGGLIAIFDAVHAASPEGKLEKINKASEDLKNNITETTEKVEGLKSAFDQYDSVIEKLNSCVRGTDEWKQALQDVNDQVLTILDSYPELMNAEGLYESVDGVLQFNMDKVNEIIGDYEQQQKALKMTDVLMTSQQAEARLAVKEDDVETTLRADNMLQQMYDSNGQLLNNPANQIFDMITASAKSFSDAMTDAQFEETIRGIISPLEQQGYELDTIVMALSQYKSEILDLAKDIKSTDTITDNVAKTMISQNLGDVYDNTNEVAVASAMLQNEINNIENGLETLNKGLNKWSGKNDKELTNSEKTGLWDRYEKAIGRDLTLAQNAVRGTDNNRSFAYLENGEEKIVTYDELAATIAATEALEKLGQSASEVAATLNKIDTSKIGGSDFKEFIGSGNFTTMDGNTVKQLSGDDGMDYSEAESYLKNILGENKITNELAQKYGYDTATELINAVMVGVNDQIGAMEQVGASMVDTVKESFDKAMTQLEGTLSASEQSQLGDMLGAVLVDSGKESMEKVSDAFGKMGEDADDFLKVFNEIEWESATVESFKEALEDAGVETKGMDEALQILVDAMGEAEEATLSLAEAQQAHADFQELGDLEFGDTISQEQMQSMIDVNPALAQYFQLMGDGTYALVEDAEYFQGIIEDLSFKPLVDQIESMQRQYDTLSMLSGDFDYESSVNSFKSVGRHSISDETTQKGLDYLNAAGYENTEQMADWQTKLSEGTMSSSDWYAIGEAIEECGDKTGDFSAEMEELAGKMHEMQEAINFTAYKDHVEDLGLDFQTTERYAQELMDSMNPEEYDDVETAARNLAIANQRLDRGLSNLASNWDDYAEKLQDVNKYSTEYVETLDALKTDIADVFNTDASLLSDGFIEELASNQEQMIAIADGNMEVINSLRASVAEEVMMNVRVQVDDSQLEQFDEAYNYILNNLPDLETGVFLNGEDAFIAQLNNLIHSANMTRDQVNAMLGAMGMSAELETKYVPQDVEVPVYTTKETITTFPKTINAGVGLDGTPITGTIDEVTKESYTVQTGTETVPGMVPVTSIKTIAADGTSSGGGLDILTGTANSSAPKISPSSSNVYNPSTGKGGYTGNKNSGGGGGGGSSEPKTSELKNLDEEIDRYYEIDNALEAISRQLKKIQNQSDTLYGASKIAAMEHEVQVLKEQEAAYKAKAAAAREYIDTDRQAIAALGYSVSYDAEGNIANYNELMSNAVSTLNSYKSQYNSMTAEQQEAFQPVLDAAEQRYEDLKSAMSQYEDTLQAFRDAEDAAEEARLQRLAKNYEILAHELEYKLYNIEARIQEIDYYVDKLSDDFYSMGEALAILSGKTDEYFNVLGQYGTFVDKLHSQYAAGEITQADYVDGLKDSYDAILDNLEALQELDKTMLEYYGETLKMAKEELEKYTNQIDHLNDVLDHYQSIMKLIGRETNYDQMGALLEGQAKIRRDSMDVAKANYEMLKREKEAILESLNSVEEGSDAWEVYKKQLDDITEALIEAEDEMLTRTEEWVEAMKSVLENDLAKAYQNLEKAFTNGLGFDYLNDSVDRVRDQYDLLLTETNKLYETNKLMNSAQTKADQATSQASKQKLKNFINETQALQDKTQLSKIELEIQQAKYDLLLAEIALEEAQNAKSRVRLQRDAEGNFNYVYTSDSEAISNAEQELADKENALYNVRLEAANAAGEQMLATAEAWADAIYQVDLDYMNGVITSEEEWRRRRAEINDQYSKIMQLYQDNYNAATWEDSRIVAESWCNEETGAYPLIIKKGEEWMTATGEYIDTVDIAFKEWQSVVEEMTGLVGEDLDETTQKVEELTDASESLKDEIIGEVIPAIESELDSVRDLTSAYAAQRSEIMSLISQYEALARSIREAIQAQSELNSYTPPASPNLSQDVPGGTVTDPPLASTDDKTGGHTGGGGGGGSPSTTPKNTYTYWEATGTTENYKYIAYGFNTESAARNAATAKKSQQETGVPFKSLTARKYTRDKMEACGISVYRNTKASGNGRSGREASYDTGGYTGSWGPEGKLATLHEKELVLNKSDTKNMLTAVEIVRDINHQIENSAKYFGGIGANIHLPGISDMSQILEQTVHIDANFPNVKDKYEIEEAFENIINMASQFANRKKI